MTISIPWQERVGNQRDWVWRGWQTRYTYRRAVQPIAQTAPLILLHGFGASIGHWRHNIDDLSQQHTVYALDMLGFGASEKAVAPYSVSLWVEQVYDFWQTFIRVPVVLVGNSIGSLVCMAAAAAHPDMVAGIVMMSLPDPSLEAEMIPAKLRPAVAATKGLVASLVLKPLFYAIRRTSVIRKWAAFAYSDPTAITDELVDILLHPATDRGSAQAFVGIFKAMSIAESGLSAKEILPLLQIPILLIWGEDDRMVPPEFAQPKQFAAYNPNLELIELANCGHCPHDECPDRVNREILRWMATNLNLAKIAVQPSAEVVVR